MYAYRSCLALLTLATATLVGCSSATTNADETVSLAAPPTATTTAATPTVQPVIAQYTLVEDTERNYRALVETADSKSLNLAWQKIRQDFLDNYPDGGYFVRFDCAIDDNPDAAANRLANAKVTVGALGAAQTGLKKGQHEFKMNDNARCGDDPGFKATFDREAPLSEQVAIDICNEHIDDQYTVEQVPATLADVKATATNGKWTVTGTSQGNSPYGVNPATMVFTCNVWKTDSGTVMRDLPRFETQ